VISLSLSFAFHMNFLKINTHSSVLARGCDAASYFEWVLTTSNNICIESITSLKNLVHVKRWSHGNIGVDDLHSSGLNRRFHEESKLGSHAGICLFQIFLARDWN
jgi:hypothetical protein